MSDPEPVTYGHPAIDEVMQWFEHKQLPPHLQIVSAEVGQVARNMAINLGEDGGPELTKGLAKLLEAKDCFVRAALRSHRLRADRTIGEIAGFMREATRKPFTGDPHAMQPQIRCIGMMDVIEVSQHEAAGVDIYQCCNQAGDHNGYGTDGPLTFRCPRSCSCHD